MIGKTRRLNRLYNSVSGTLLLVPLDHGFTQGPIKGLDTMDRTIKKLLKGGVDALLMHKGMVMSHYQLLENTSTALIMHLSGISNMGPDPHYKVITGSVYDALSMGCDAVSLHINIGSKRETDMVRDAATISSQCIKFGMPLIIMAFTRGDVIDNEYDKDMVKHAARIGAELGADIVKVNYTGDRASFEEVVHSTPVPLLIAGGEKIDNDRALLQMISDAMQAGARGISMGRNIFQHENMEEILKLISLLVHDRKTLDEVWSTGKTLLKNISPEKE